MSDTSTSSPAVTILMETTCDTPKPFAQAKRKISNLSSNSAAGQKGSDPRAPSPTTADPTACKRLLKDVPDRLLNLSKHRYKNGHPGPYEVHIEKVIAPASLSESAALQKVRQCSEIRIGKICRNLFPNLWKVRDLKNMGANKFRVFFSDANMTNQFIQEVYDKRDALIADSIWVAYIPSYKIFRYMVTTDIDHDESPEEICNELEPPLSGRATGPGQ